MNLKARVLVFVSQHSAGVSVIDMEESLGEKRMRLGYVTQLLLDEGRIRKEGDKYYPFDEEESDQRYISSISNIKG